MFNWVRNLFLMSYNGVSSMWNAVLDFIDRITDIFYGDDDADHMNDYHQRNDGGRSDADNSVGDTELRNIDVGEHQRNDNVVEHWYNIASENIVEDADSDIEGRGQEIQTGDKKKVSIFVSGDKDNSITPHYIYWSSYDRDIQHKGEYMSQEMRQEIDSAAKVAVDAALLRITTLLGRYDKIKELFFISCRFNADEFEALKVLLTTYSNKIESVSMIFSAVNVGKYVDDEIGELLGLPVEKLFIISQCIENNRGAKIRRRINIEQNERLKYLDMIDIRHGSEGEFVNIAEKDEDLLDLLMSRREHLPHQATCITDAFGMVSDLRGETWLNFKGFCCISSKNVERLEAMRMLESGDRDAMKHFKIMFVNFDGPNWKLLLLKLRDMGALCTVHFIGCTFSRRALNDIPHIDVVRTIMCRTSLYFEGCYVPNIALLASFPVRSVVYKNDFNLMLQDMEEDEILSKPKGCNVVKMMDELVERAILQNIQSNINIVEFKVVGQQFSESAQAQYDNMMQFRVRREGWRE